MDMIQGFQEYFFKTKSPKANGGDNAAENGSLHRCGTQSYCCCPRRRDCSTSTYDLSTYIWHTEGDGVGINISIRGDEDDCGRCRTGSCCGRQQGSFGGRSPSKCCKMAQGNVCASTSTFDLSTYVWGTDGDMYTTYSGLDEDVEDDDIVHDSGRMDNAATSWGFRKRPRADTSLGFSTSRSSGGLAAPPRKKKRRIGNQKD